MRATTAILTTLTTLVTAGTAVTVSAAPARAALAPCFTHSTQAQNPANSGVVVSWNLPSIVREVREDGFRAANINCRLQVGDGGPGVFVLQDALRRCLGHTSLPVDAIYGPLTRNAILWEQARNGFRPEDRDGVYGPQTRAVLRFPVYVNGAPAGRENCRQG
jgi:hypothetical protein